MEISHLAVIAGDQLSRGLGDHSYTLLVHQSSALLRLDRQDSKTNVELIQLAHRWIALDWFRVAMIALAFVSSVRAINLLIADRSSL